jgi:hypothetical protein
MSDRRFIYDHTGTKIKEIVVHDAENFTVLTRENMDAGLEYVKQRRELVDKKAHYREVAWIPDSVFAQAVTEGRVHDKKYWARWLNDADNRAFRIDGGYISGREGRG